MRTVRARSGRGQRDGPVGRDRQRRASARPSATTRTRVGKRTRTGARARRSERTVARRARAPLKPRRRRPSHPAGRSTPAAGRRRTPTRRGCARAPRSASSRRTAVVPRAPAQRSRTRSGVSGATLTHASAAPAAGGGRRDDARPAALAVLLVADEPARAVGRDDARAVRVVAGRAVEEVRQGGAAEVRAAERALDQHRRAQRLGRPHARDPQLADAARARLARRAAAGRARSATSSDAHAAQAEREPVPARPDRALAPVDRDALDPAAAVGVRHEVDVVDVARRP